MAKLAEMLTLPEAISDALPDNLSKSEIREIKKEYEAEQNITDIEVAIEAAELEASETGHGKQADDKYDVVYHIIKNWLHDNPQDFLKLCDGIEQSEDEEFVKDIIAPDGTKVIITRVPGVGKLMMTCKTDEGIEIVNMRSSETKKAEWSEVDDAVVFLCAKDEGETYKDVWQREYKEPYPETIKEPEKTKEPEQTKTPAKEKKTEKRKQSKVAVVNKKESEKASEPIPEDPPKEPEAAARSEEPKPEETAQKEVKPEQFETEEKAAGQETITEKTECVSLEDYIARMKFSFQECIEYLSNKQTHYAKLSMAALTNTFESILRFMSEEAQ